MTTAIQLLHRGKFRAATYLSTRPRFYYGVRRLSGGLDRLCVRRDTDIVIEGFPRSANSTTVHRFLERQPGDVQVAHHKHHAAQIIQAARWHVPAVVLIREPQSACLSLLALIAEARFREGKPGTSDLTFSDVLSAYVAFYESVEPHLDHVVIGRFESLHNDIVSLVERVNDRFGTDFHAAPIPTTPQPELGWHAMPNDIRDGIKRKIRAEFEKRAGASSGLRGLLERARSVHARYGEINERAS